jgi:hypothetical protein
VRPLLLPTLLVAVTVLSATGCPRSVEPVRATSLRVKVSGAADRTVQVSSLQLAGAKSGRGYVSLDQLSLPAGALTFTGADGDARRPARATFPGEHRLFVRRNGGVQLVRFRGSPPAPPPGSREDGHGKRHRKRWEVLLEDVREVQVDADAS